MPAPALAPLMTLPLVGWMVYRRIQRNFGRHLIRPGWLGFRVGLFSLALIAMASIGLVQPWVGASVVVAAAVGAALAFFWGLRLTGFDVSAEGVYYRPNPVIGSILTALLVARLGWRFLRVSGVMAGAAPVVGYGTPTPLTFGLLGLLVGYYLTYSLGLLLKRRTLATT